MSAFDPKQTLEGEAGTAAAKRTVSGSIPAAELPPTVKLIPVSLSDPLLEKLQGSHCGTGHPGTTMDNLRELGREPVKNVRCGGDARGEAGTTPFTQL